jgi:ferredoxin-NADP reductase
VSDIVYEEVFNESSEKLGIKTIYAITDTNSPGYSGARNSEMITSQIPYYNERYFYISGPHGMVMGFKQTLKDLGVKKSQVKIDFFPGFA